MESGKWKGKNVQGFDARLEKVHFVRFMRNDNLLRCGQNFRGDFQDCSHAHLILSKKVSLNSAWDSALTR